VQLSPFLDNRIDESKSNRDFKQQLIIKGKSIECTKSKIIHKKKQCLQNNLNLKNHSSNSVMKD